MYIPFQSWKVGWTACCISAGSVDLTGQLVDFQKPMTVLFKAHGGRGSRLYLPQLRPIHGRTQAIAARKVNVTDARREGLAGHPNALDNLGACPLGRSGPHTWVASATAQSPVGNKKKEKLVKCFLEDAPICVCMSAGRTDIVVVVGFTRPTKPCVDPCCFWYPLIAACQTPR